MSNFDPKKVKNEVEISNVPYLIIGNDGKEQADLLEGDEMFIKLDEFQDRLDKDGVVSKELVFINMETQEKKKTSSSLLVSRAESCPTEFMKIKYLGKTKGNNGRSYHDFECTAFDYEE